MDMENTVDCRNSGAAVCLPVFPGTGILANTSEICRRRSGQAGISREIEAHHLDVHYSFDVDALVHGRETEFVVNKWKPGLRARAFFSEMNDLVELIQNVVE